MELNAIFEESNAECTAEFDSMILFDSVGQTTKAGGEIFSDYEKNEANAKYATAFGTENKAHGVASFASGAKQQHETDTPYPKDENGNAIIPDDAWRYNEAVGTASTAMGMGNVAFSRASKAFGFRTQTGYPPSAEWVEKRPEIITDGTYPADNVGQAAFAIGADTVAVGNQSIAGGWRAIAYGPHSFALGSPDTYGEMPTQAIGKGAVAIGKGVRASGLRSVAMGVETEASGNCSMALGNGSIASGSYSIALGKTEASGSYAIASGTSKALNSHAIAMGVNCTNESYGSFATGQNNVVDKLDPDKKDVYYGFAANSNNTVRHTASTALGYGNSTSNKYQLVAGRYGKDDTEAYFVVGNGTSASAKKNAFAVHSNGDAIIAGKADISGNCSIKGKLSFGSVDPASIQKTFFKADLMEGVDLVDNMAVTGLGLRGEYDGQLAVSRNNGYCRAYIWLASAWVKIAEVKLN